MLRRAYFIAGTLTVMACAPSSHVAQPGFLEGHLTIVSLAQTERAGAAPSKGMAENENYADHPLLVLSGTGQEEIARVIADAHGNFRVALPPGAYVLDAQGRAPGRIRAKPKAFRVVSRETVRVDFDLDTGVR
jgi:hypothetical protein